jgi:hypothetical protein
VIAPHQESVAPLLPTADRGFSADLQPGSVDCPWSAAKVFRGLLYELGVPDFIRPQDGVPLDKRRFLCCHGVKVCLLEVLRTPEMGWIKSCYATLQEHADGRIEIDDVQTGDHSVVEGHGSFSSRLDYNWAFTRAIREACSRLRHARSTATDLTVIFAGRGSDGQAHITTIGMPLKPELEFISLLEAGGADLL